jgi:outer membrane protein OmpA-like peptidoglycan-associated protein
MKQPALLLSLSFLSLFPTFSALQAQNIQVYAINQIPDKVVNSVAVDFRNTKWVGTENGLYQLIGDKASKILPPKIQKMAVSVVIIDELGNRWVGTYNSQVFCLKDNNEWQTHDFNNFGNHWISGLAIDHEQTLWVAAYEYGVIKQTADGQQTVFALNEAIDALKIYTLFADHDGKLWIGTEKGLFALEKGEKKWKRVEFKTSINAIAEYDGDLWLTLLTEKGEAELWRYKKMEDWEKVTLPEAIARDRIKEIAFDTQGNCWLAASQIAAWEQGTWKLYDKSKGFNSEASLDVAADLQGNIWAGTEGKGLFQLRKETSKVVENANIKPVVIEPVRKQPQMTLAEITDVQTMLNKDIKLNIGFEQSKAVLLPQSLEELDRLVALLQKNSDLLLEVAGHTDNIGNPVANQLLSEERGKTVKQYLVQKGIPTERITTIGYGGKYPLADNKNDKTRPFNRRVEIRLMKK